MVVFALGKNLLFKSALGHCVMVADEKDWKAKLESAYSFMLKYSKINSVVWVEIISFSILKLYYLNFAAFKIFKTSNLTIIIHLIYNSWSARDVYSVARQMIAKIMSMKTCF